MVEMRGRFADREVERTFSLTERQSKTQMVRLYGALTLLVMLTYALINPLFFSQEDEVRFSLLLIPTLAVLGLCRADLLAGLCRASADRFHLLTCAWASGARGETRCCGTRQRPFQGAPRQRRHQLVLGTALRSHRGADRVRWLCCGLPSTLPPFGF
jgi:hypothetical protein